MELITFLDTPLSLVAATEKTWLDFDLSAYIPDGATGVIIRIYNGHYADADVGWRKNGSTDVYKQSIASTTQIWAYCGVDENLIIELYSYVINTISFNVIGYFNSDAVFFTNSLQKNATVGEIWQDKDISLDIGTDDAIAVILGANGNLQYNMGFRSNGSTDNRYSAVNRRAGIIVGVDNNKIYECYAQYTTDIFFYMSGYIKENYVVLINATDISLPIANVYSDIVLPTEAIAGVIEVVDGNYYTFDLRKKGSTIENFKSNSGHNWAVVECDSQKVIEGKIGNTGLDFFLTGYVCSIPSITINYDMIYPLKSPNLFPTYLP